jgi:pilus assembly protein CpaE
VNMISHLGLGGAAPVFTAGAPARKCVGVLDQALSADCLARLKSLCPNVEFVPLRAITRAGGLDLLFVRVSGARPAEIDYAQNMARELGPTCSLVILLDDADVNTTRRLAAAGVADILPLPVPDPSLVLCLERLLADNVAEQVGAAGEIIGILKAGGGVGATTIGVQLAAWLARRSGRQSICYADLDLQFGTSALYLDLPQALTIADFLSSTEGLAEVDFDPALARHVSGLRLLAAPSELSPLERLNSTTVDALLHSLRREMALTLVDLPSVWTAWTDRALHVADRIVLVTSLSVPHLRLTQRQLTTLQSQELADKPLTLVCNRCTAEQQSSLPIKVAERTLGRSFDVIIPEDRQLVASAANQGLEFSAIHRGSKAEKAIAALADIVAGRILRAQGK